MGQRATRREEAEIRWDDLESFLEPDPSRRSPEHFAAQYRQVKTKLEWFFGAEGFTDPEDLAQRTILRVARKCAAVSADYVGDRTRYFLGFARNIAKEEWKKAAKGRHALRVPEPDPWHEKEAHDYCLRECLDQLETRELEAKGWTPRDRHWMLEYHAGSGGDRIRRRKQLAKEMQRSRGSLATLAHRTLDWLTDCVRHCAGQLEPYEGPTA